MGNIVYCHSCGKPCISKYDFAAGYGVDSDGHKICYDCCGKMDRERLDNLKIGDKICFYLNANNEVVNWPGTLKIKCYAKEGYHNMAGRRTDVHFSFNGKQFWGVSYGYNSEICYIKRIKN